MNQRERDETRAKHTPSSAQDDWTMCPTCRTSGGCDVVRVLDAWEADLARSNPSDCAHTDWSDEPYVDYLAVGYAHCPKCGEQL